MNPSTLSCPWRGQSTDGPSRRKGHTGDAVNGDLPRWIASGVLLGLIGASGFTATMGRAIPAVNFGLTSDFSLGVEEELVLVDPASHGLDHGAVEILRRLSPGGESDGAIHPEYYAGLIELSSPICADT